MALTVELRKAGTALDDIAETFGRAIRIVRLERTLGDIDRAACDFVEGRAGTDIYHRTRLVDRAICHHLSRDRFR